jgi:hypothetical protein
VLLFLGKNKATSVQLSILILGRHIPSESFVNLTSHCKTVEGMLNDNAKLYANLLESGNNPEKPPFATTWGAFPALEKKNRHVILLNI